MAELIISFPTRRIEKSERRTAAETGLGAFYFSKDKMNLWAVLPDCDGTPIWHRFNIGCPDLSPYWKWDGDEDKPTLTPSLWWPGHWHGFLTNGEFITCK